MCRKETGRRLKLFCLPCLSQRESQVGALLPLPLGEVSERSEDGEGMLNVAAKNPLSRLRRQLSQGESQGLMRIRTILLILMAVSIDCTHSKALANKPDANLTCGAYHSARDVTRCE